MVWKWVKSVSLPLPWDGHSLFARKKLVLQPCSNSAGRLTFPWGGSLQSSTAGISFTGTLQKVHLAESSIQVVSSEDKGKSASAPLIFKKLNWM